MSEEKLNTNNLKYVELSPNDTTQGFLNESVTSSSPIKPNLDLTPTGSRLRSRSIKYEGDPDLHPIRTTENAFMVRMLYHIAQQINTAYYDHMQRAFHRQDFLGRLSRNVLLSPLVTYSYDKSVPGVSPRVQKLLPARISLRYFASHHFLAYAFIALLFTKFLGYNTFFIIFVAILFWLMLIVVKSICYKNERAELNESFNDLSF